MSKTSRNFSRPDYNPQKIKKIIAQLTVNNPVTTLRTVDGDYLRFIECDKRTQTIIAKQHYKEWT